MKTQTMNAFTETPLRILEDLRHQWGWFLALGIALIILGTVAIIHSVTATITSVLLLGFLLLVGGLIQVFHAAWAPKWKGFLLQLLAGVLQSVVGLLMIAHPGLGALSLTLMLASLFMALGFYRILTAVLVKPPRAGWMVFGGILNIVLGALIWWQWPISALWIIGTFIGVDLIISGWTAFAFAVSIHKLPEQQNYPQMRTS